MSLSDHTSDMMMSNCGNSHDCNPQATAELMEIVWSPIGMLGMVLFAAITVIYCITYKS